VANSISVAPFRGDVGGLDRVGLRRDHRAVEVDLRARQPDIGARVGRDVGLGEVDHLVALVGDRHAGDDGVVVARHEVGDDRIPVVGDPFAGQLGARAQLVAQLALEAVDLAASLMKLYGG
jgi:hypothetical protein